MQTQTERLKDLPEVNLIRQRIDSIKDEQLRFCFMAEYLFCARISEIIGRVSPSDITTEARGITGGDVKQTLFKFRNEYYDVIVFTVRTAKRHGKIRKIALPLDRKYEPFTEQLFEYVREFGKNQYVFPFTRQKAWQEASIIFQGLEYPIETYVVSVNGEKQPPILEHMKPFRTHALRHLRATELLEQYDFSGVELSLYGGWTLRSTVGVGSSLSRYSHVHYRKYLPKLLVERTDMLNSPS
jgi:hypothetical protein